MAEEKDEKIEVPEKFKKMVGEIEKMSVLDLAELVKVLEKKFGVSAAVGEKKIEVIKAVRDLTGKGLKEAKDLVDAAASAPQMIKEGAKKEEAEEIKKKFEAAGAKVELK
ncbi:MAG: ribosomal protein L7/L12 [Candidatus Nealsonbacteria bacterium]|nr:ribosomal protein L7/L12 [Candidatus Nealsonbacteria bacterium]